MPSSDMDIDDLEDKLGGMSLYQVLSLISAGWMVLSSVAASQTGVFYNAVPQHRCSLSNFLEEKLHENFTYDNITLAIPSGDSCHHYAYNSTECLIAEDLSCLDNASEKEVISCDNGYFYDKKYFGKTVISEWDLVCKKQIWVAVLNSLYFVGILFGSPLVGYVNDRFGRKFSLIVLAFGIIGSGLGCTFSPNLAVYCLFRFFEGVSTIPAVGVALTYGTELSSKKSRMYIGPACAVFIGIPVTLVPVIALFLRDWRDLNLCLALLPVVFLCTCPCIPETPRWLLAKGRTSQAKKVVDRIAKSKETISNNDWKLVVEAEKNKMGIKESSLHLTDLFRYPCGRIVTLITMFNWAAIGCVFYGLVLNVATLSGDLYTNAILNGAFEMAAGVPYVIIVLKKGPRPALIVGTLMSGAFCIVALVAGVVLNSYAASTEIVRWSSIIGKFFASIALYSTYQFTNDLFPTVTRGKAMGLASMSARIGSSIIPFVLYAQIHAQWVVQMVFGILAISSALLTMLLPDSETLTTTLSEAENYYRTNMKLVGRFLRKSPKPDDGVDNDGFKSGDDVPEVYCSETEL